MIDRRTDPNAALGTFEDWNLTRPVLLHLVNELGRALVRDALDGEGQLGGLVAGYALDVAVLAIEGRVRAQATDLLLERVAVMVSVLYTQTDAQRAAVRAILDAVDPAMEHCPALGNQR